MTFTTTQVLSDLEYEFDVALKALLSLIHVLLKCLYQALCYSKWVSRDISHCSKILSQAAISARLGMES